MERELANHLLLIASAYATAKGLKLSYLGRLAAWDGRFFENLRDPSKSFTARKYDDVLAFFSAHWPEEGLEWPAHIVRPDRSKWAEIAARAVERAANRRPASGTTEASAA